MGFKVQSLGFRVWSIDLLGSDAGEVAIERAFALSVGGGGRDRETELVCSGGFRVKVEGFGV